MSSFPQADVTIVRDLVRQVMELACSDEYEIRRKRWRDVNGLRKPDRAPVWCRPAGVWREILPPEVLKCTDPLCRHVEYVCRQHLYKDWVGDDHTVEPWWDVGAAWDCDTKYAWGMRTGNLTASTEEGGFHYEPPMQSVEDYARLTVPTYTYNHQRTQQSLERMADLLGDTMPVRLACEPPLGPHHSIYLHALRGMAPMLGDLAFHPEIVHRALAKMTEGIFHALRSAEESGMLTQNNYNPMTCSDPLNGGEDENGKVGLHNLWCLTNSQEYQEVSPKMHEEFLLNYQIPIFQQYGAVQYGCCENLTQKITGVLRIPNLRVFVCSYWTNLDTLLEACGTRYTIMWREHAATVIFAEDMAPIRTRLEENLRKLQGHYYQVILREVETLQGRPNRIKEWAQAAIEMAEKYA